MLVALDTTREPIEATRELVGDRFTCPACSGPMLLKRGQVKIAHFAHLPGAECWSEPESVTHLRAKQLLAERFREQGYQVRLEETHHRHGRRVDVAVTMPTGHRVAVEVQNSAIAVDEAKARTRLDQRLGFLGTLWVFTHQRAQILLNAAQPEADIEIRVPKEVLWVDNRFGQGVFVLDVDAGAVWRLTLGSAFEREGYDQDGNTHFYQPRTLKYVTSTPAAFALTCRPGRYDKEWAVIFAPAA